MNEYFVSFVLASNPDGMGKGALNLNRDHVGETPIRDNLERAKISFGELNKFIQQYGELLEWMTDAIAMEKMRRGDFATLTKEQAFFEGKSCFRDLLAKIDRERVFIEQRANAGY